MSEPLRILAEPVKGGDLLPGDLFSTVGPEYWDVQTRGAIGERVYIRTNAPTPPDQRDEPVYRITIIRAVVTLTLLLLATSVRAQAVGPAPYLTLTIGSGIDLGTTLHALHTVPGAIEANPLLSHGGTTGLVIGKVVSTAALAVVMKQIGLRGHPRVARSIGYVAGVALAGLGARNATVGR